MSHKTINLRIPPGVKWISIDYHEELAKDIDTLERAFREAACRGAVEVPLTTQSEEPIRKATGLDILRMRGTPIELIGSAIAAQDWDTANATFRTSILEYVYEKLEAFTGANVRFINSRALADVVRGPLVTIGLTPEHDTCVHPESCTVPVCKVESGEVREVINDHISASVMAIVENITGNIISEITVPLDKLATQHQISTLEIRVVVDLFEHKLHADAKEITAHASVPMVAYAQLSQN